MELCVNFMFAAHAAEAAYAAHLAHSLGLDARSVMGWTLRTFLAGVGALGRLTRLANTTTLPGYEAWSKILARYHHPRCKGSPGLPSK